MAARAALRGIIPQPPGGRALNGGNLRQTQDAVASSLRKDNSLGAYLGAVDALTRVNADQAALQPYRSQAQKLAYQQVQSGASQPLPWVATATFALQDQNQALFRATTRQMLEKFPNDPHGHYFTGVQAIEEGDWASAERALKRAEALGMPKESIADMLRLAIDRQRWIWHYAILTGVVGLVWAFGLGCLYVSGVWLSRWTLLAAQRDDPTARDAGEHRLRWLYRRLIDVASVYYFLSLPVLLVLSIALPLSLAYAALMLPYLNLWVVGLVLVGGVAGVVTAVSGVRTAFVRTPERAPGRLLSKHEAPDFWGVLGEVAEKVGTEPVDEVWVTPQTDMAVFERGGSRVRLMGRRRRALIFGVGLLPGFQVDALKAILAHEYAHFLHGDTAGGDVALRVREAMHRHAEAIAERGVIRSWDIAIWYLKLYYRLFGELTYGASRLQEVLADRRAVENYGSTAFVTGLNHVVRRGFEFDTLVNEALKNSTRLDEPAVAFYAPNKTLTAAQKEAVKDRVRDAYQLPELPGDSHPSLAKRYAAARQSGTDRPVGRESVTKLFGATARRLASEMLREINGGIAHEAKLAKAQNQHALRQVESVIDRDPSYDLIQTRAVLHFRNGDYELALDDLDLLLEVLPNDLNAVLSRSNLYDVMGDDKRMVQDLLLLRKNAAHLPRDEQVDVEMRLGAVLTKYGKHSQAARAYEEAISLAPESANAILGRLNTAEKTGELKSAEMRELVERFAKLCPQDPDLHRLARAAGVTLDPDAARASVAMSDQPRSVGTTKSLLALGGLAAAASLGAVATYLYWPSGAATFVSKANAVEESDQDLGSLIDSALPAIPQVEPPAADAAPDATQAAAPPADPEVEVTVAPEIQIIGDDLNDSGRSPVAQQSKVARRPLEAPPRPPVSEAPEPEPKPLSPREVLREASDKLRQIGKAFKQRERKEGLMLAAQADQKLSWRVHLLPYLGLNELYEEFDLDTPWDHEPNKLMIDRIPEVYQLNSGAGQTRLRVMVGDKLLVRPNANTESRFAVDGVGTTSLAYFVGPEQETPWTCPDTESLDLDKPLQSLGLGPSDLMVALMASGDVMAFDEGVHPKKLLALATAQGAETISTRRWFSGGRSNQPPPPVIGLPKRAEGKPETEVFVRLPRVKAPLARRRAVEAPTPDPIETRLKKIGSALHAYHDRNSGFPVGNCSENRDPDGEPMLSWRVHLLPFLDHHPLYKRFRLDEPWDSEHNRELIRFMPAIYSSDRSSSSKTRFLGLAGPHQFFDGGGGLSFREVVDGSSNTLAVVHAGQDKAVPWTKPADLQLDLKNPGRSLGRIGGSVACLRVDGRVMHLPKKLPRDAWAALATYRGGELTDGETLRRLGEHAAGRPLAEGPFVARSEMNRLKQIGLAMDNYSHAAGGGRFPADMMLRNDENQFVPTLSWRVRLLPYLEHGALYEQFRRDEPWDSEHNRMLIDYMPDVFRDADDSINETRTRIQVLTGVGVPYGTAHQRGRGPSRREFTDGAGSTILAIQTDARRAVIWTQPADVYFDPADPSKSFGRADPQIGRLTLMADGAVYALPHRTPLQILAALSTLRGGEVVDDSWRYGN